MYYNPMEVSDRIRYISKTRGIDYVYEMPNVPEGFPVWFPDLFQSMKKGEFDEIIVSVTSHDGCYYSKKIDSSFYERVPLVGDIALSEFSDGGGYLQDKHFYKS